MAANDLAITAATTQGAFPSVTNATNSPSPAPSGASAVNELLNQCQTSESTGDAFGAMLTQLLGAPNAPPVAATEMTEQVTQEATDAEQLSDDSAANANGIQMPTSAAVPWELLASAAVASRASQVVKADNGFTSTQRDAAVGPAVPVAVASASSVPGELGALLTRANFTDQAAQVVRDMQSRAGQGTTASADALQALKGERTTSDGVGLVNTLPVLNARLDAAEEQAHVRAHVGAAAWADELGAKLTWLTERGMQSASLRLSPEHLGPMEIRISINSDQASVWFGAAHADTRTALEQALPRLREMFASQGLHLADAGVFREPPREQSRDYRGANRSLGNGDEQEIRIATLRAQGGIDAYA